MESNVNSNASQATAAGGQPVVEKVSWKDKPIALVLSKVFAWASLALSLIGLTLYGSVSGKGIGEVFKYIIGAWTGIIGIPLGITGKILSKDKAIKWIAIGGIVLGAFVLVLGIGSLINGIGSSSYR